MLVNVTEAARLLAVSESTFLRHVAPAIPSVRIGAKLKRWRKEDVENYTSARNQAGTHTIRRSGYMVRGTSGVLARTTRKRLSEFRQELKSGL